MTYLQLTLAGIHAEVIHGNTLSLEVFESAYTRSTVRFLDIHGNIFDEKKKQELTPKPLITFAPSLQVEIKQLALF